MKSYLPMLLLLALSMSVSDGAFAQGKQWRLYQTAYRWDGQGSTALPSVTPEQHIATFDAPMPDKIYQYDDLTGQMVEVDNPQERECERVRAAMLEAYPEIEFACYETARGGDL